MKVRLISICCALHNMRRNLKTVFIQHAGKVLLVLTSFYCWRCFCCIIPLSPGPVSPNIHSINSCKQHKLSRWFAIVFLGVNLSVGLNDLLRIQKASLTWTKYISELEQKNRINHNKSSQHLALGKRLALDINSAWFVFLLTNHNCHGRRKAPDTATVPLQNSVGGKLVLVKDLDMPKRSLVLKCPNLCQWERLKNSLV